MTLLPPKNEYDMEDERPIVILVHPLLKLELQKRKEEMEKHLGYVLHGGIPIITKIAALELKKLREKGCQNINIELHKKKGVKRVEMLKIW